VLLLQELYNGKTITVKLINPSTREPVNVVFTLRVKFPDDMSCHWSAFQDGGGTGGPEARPCHRFNCTKENLGKAFARFEVQEGETLEDIATRTGYTMEFLREINLALNSHLDLVYRKFQKSLPPPPEPAAARAKGRGGKKAPNPSVEWAPTISLDKDSLPRDDEPIGKG
jgi:hypothetical protein